MRPDQSNDHQWDLVIEIATKLWVDGQFVFELNPVPTQRFVDLHWAARQAGRVLGGRAVLRTSAPGSPEDPTIAMTVTYLDPTGRALLHAEEGLEALMRMVLEHNTSE